MKQETGDRLEDALAALRQSETKFRCLADLIAEQVWTASPDGKLDYVNQRVCTYFVRLRRSGKLDRRFGKRGIGSYFGKPRSDVLEIKRNGSPNRSFGRRGAARFTFKCRSINIGCDQDAMSVNVDDKGRIVAAGTAVVRRAPNSRFFVLRLNRKGKLDRSFGRRVMVFWQVGRTYPGFAAIDPRGRIVALAGSNNGSGQTIQLARYLP